MVMVRVQRQGGVVCLFRVMVRGSVWIDYKWGSAEVCVLSVWCGVVPEQWKMEGPLFFSHNDDSK